MSETFVRLRGLPWSASVDDVKDFMHDVTIKDNGVYLPLDQNGKPSGEAYVELADEYQMDNALAHNNGNMGKRYIEVFSSTRTEVEWRQKNSGKGKAKGSVVRLRGLPYDAGEDSVREFFDGLDIVPNGVGLVMDREGRSTGEGFVQFASPSVAEQALSKNMAKMGHRYIEIFYSTMNEARNALEQMNCDQYGGDDGNGYGGGNNGWGGAQNWNLGAGGSDMYMGGMGGDHEGGGVMRMRGMRNVGRQNPYSRMVGGGQLQGGGGGPMSLMDIPTGAGMGMGGGGPRGFRGGGSGPSRGGRGRGGMGGGMGGRGGSDRPGADWNSSTGFSVHLRGLPWSASEDDIRDFLSPAMPSLVKVHFLPSGKATGEADCDFMSYEEASQAKACDRKTMGSRYIEVFLNCGGGGGGGGAGDMGQFAFDTGMGGFGSGGGGNGAGFQSGYNQGGNNQGDSKYAVHLRGLPWSASESDIYSFMNPLQPCYVEILYNDNGRASGEADVYFQTAEDVLLALKKNKECIGTRYIEVYQP